MDCLLRLVHSLLVRAIYKHFCKQLIGKIAAGPNGAVWRSLYDTTAVSVRFVTASTLEHISSMFL